MKEVVDSHNLKVLYPTYGYFIDKIQRGEQFSYTRVQHAIADLLIESYGLGLDDLNNLLRDIQLKNYNNLADKVVHSKNKIFEVWNNYTKDSLKHFSLAYKVMCENNSLIPHLHLAVSANTGFGMNSFGSLPENHPMQQTRALVLQIMTQSATNRYHAGLPRHMSVMGETFDFFDKLNKLDVDVVIYGPRWFDSYKETFNIKKFYHFKTLDRSELSVVDDSISSIIEKCKSLKNPLILNCTGHIISNILSYRLKDTNISNFDIGIGFNWQIRDYLKNNYPEVNNPWIRQPENLLKQYISNIRN